MMAVSTLVVLLMTTALTTAVHNRLDWSDCGSDPSVRVDRIEVSPMPVELPGPMQLTLHAHLARSLSDLEIKLSIKRNTFLLDLPIPCLSHLGSCTYETSCSGTSMLDTMINDNWGGVSSDLGTQIQTMLGTVPGLNSTQCPLPAFDIDIDGYTLNLPAMSSVVSFVAEGDYSAHVTVNDKTSGVTLLCLDLHLTLQKKQEPCTGFFCG